MGLGVSTNVAALSASRSLSTADHAMRTSLERLSSGYRINRAADDAAGLAISEGLRSRIGGMTQALRNTRDGISVVQTAEGALSASAAILQRMRDLAVQAENVGALNGTAIRAIQQEVGQLKSELTRIADAATFNGTRLLDGSYRGVFQVGAEAGDTLTVGIGTSLGASGLGLGGLDVTRVLDPDASLYRALGPQPDLDRGRVVFIGAATSASGIASLTGTIVMGSLSLDLATVDFAGATSVSEMVARLNAAAAADPDFDYEADLFKADDEDLIFRGPMPASGASTSDLAAISPQYAAASGTPTPSMARSLATTERPPSAGTISFPGRTRDDVPVLRGIVSVDGHTLDLGTVTYADTDGDGSVDGDEALAQLNAAARAAGLRGAFTDSSMMVLGDDVYTDLGRMLRFSGPTPAADATPDELTALSPGFVHVPAPISAIDEAIRMVSTQRAELGAAQNRFEHTLARLGVSIENTAAAESRIRDTDMAQETVALTRSQVLVQAGTAMLAQANQSPRAVLTLLQA